MADTEVVSSLLERNDVDKEELLQFAEEKREQIPHLLRYYKQRAGKASTNCFGNFCKSQTHRFYIFMLYRIIENAL